MVPVKNKLHCEPDYNLQNLFRLSQIWASTYNDPKVMGVNIHPFKVNTAGLTLDPR